MAEIRDHKLVLKKLSHYEYEIFAAIIEGNKMNYYIKNRLNYEDFSKDLSLPDHPKELIRRCSDFSNGFYTSMIISI